LAANAVEQWAPVGGALAAIFVASGIGLRWLVPAMDTQKNINQSLRDDNRICEYRLSAVIQGLTKEGIPVPPEAWGYPPDIAEKLGL
jgi:formiminotetrahydrofolate cyclodeaminase